jgi:hypothetical protein
MRFHCHNNSSTVKIHDLLHSTSTIGVWSWLCCVVHKETFVGDAHLASTSYSAKSRYALCLVVRRIASDQHRGGGACHDECRKPGKPVLSEPKTMACSAAAAPAPADPLVACTHRKCIAHTQLRSARSLPVLQSTQSRGSDDDVTFDCFNELATTMAARSLPSVPELCATNDISMWAKPRKAATLP